MDFRVERVLIRLSDHVDGLNPMEGIDPVELCWHTTDIDAQTIGVTPLSDFYVAGFTGYSEAEAWQPASAGLATIRALLQYYERIVADGSDLIGREMSVIEEKIALLESAERILDKADTHDVEFCLIATG